MSLDPKMCFSQVGSGSDGPSLCDEVTERVPFGPLPTPGFLLGPFPGKRAPALRAALRRGPRGREPCLCQLGSQPTRGDTQPMPTSRGPHCTHPQEREMVNVGFSKSRNFRILCYIARGNNAETLRRGVLSDFFPGLRVKMFKYQHSTGTRQSGGREGPTVPYFSLSESLLF